MNLEEITQVIKHRLTSWKLNFYDIGKDLVYVKEKKLYMGKHDTFKEYVEETFELNIKQAQRFMKIVTTVEQRSDILTLGVTKLTQIAYLPEEEREEIIQLVKEKKINREEVSKRIERFKHYSGKPPSYSESKEETIYKLIRQGQEILKLGSSYKKSIENWITEANKYKNKEISELKTKLKKHLESLC